MRGKEVAEVLDRFCDAGGLAGEEALEIRRQECVEDAAEVDASIAHFKPSVRAHQCECDGARRRPLGDVRADAIERRRPSRRERRASGEDARVIPHRLNEEEAEGAGVRHSLQ